MTEKFTRRTFLKETGTAFIGLAALGLASKATAGFRKAVHCKNCGAVNPGNGPYLCSLIRPEEPFYCRGCGINLKTLHHDIVCRHYRACVKEKTKSKRICGVPACCQVPFPNRTHLKTTRRPTFSVTDLQF